MIESGFGKTNLFGGRTQHKGRRSTALPDSADCIRERCRIADDLQCPPCACPGAGEFQRFRQPNRPCDEGSKGEADHHAFDDPVRSHEHAPG